MDYVSTEGLTQYELQIAVL